MTPKLKKIILILVVAIALFLIYAIFIKPDPLADPLIDGRAAGVGLGQADARALGNQIAQALLRIEQISLDKSIFNDAIYRSLEDRSQPITDEPIGRPNPFAPLGQNSVSSVTRTSTTTSGQTQMQVRTSTSTPASNPPASSPVTQPPASSPVVNPAASN